MREILFKGKDKYNGEWIEGYYYLSRSKYAGDKSFVSEVHTITTGITEVSGAYGEHSETIESSVIPETVGQYTGLTDKNGTKIFEGDIIARALWWQEKAKNGVVAFRDGSFGLIWYRGEVEQFNPFTSMCNITYEVIGNIHDNPELLKVGD